VRVIFVRTEVRREPIATPTHTGISGSSYDHALLFSFGE
jgi:hypothetical protein